MQLLRAAAALAAASDRRLARARVTLEPASEGGNNVVARLRCRGGVFYAKLRANRFDEAPRERWALARLAQAGTGLAPRLVHSTTAREVLHALGARGAFSQLRRADFDGGAVLFLEAVPGRRAEHLGERELGATASALARLHAVKVRSGPPLPGGATAYAMVRFMDGALDALSGARLFAARTVRRLRSCVRSAQRHLDRRWWGLDEAGRALCHGDLRPSNLLFDGGEARLLDFEHAGLADPMADLSRFVTFAGLSPPQELCLLDAYCEATGAAELERYFAYRPITPVFSALAGARYLLHVLDGDQRVAGDGWLLRRRARVETELSQVLGEPVRLGAGPRRRTPRKVVVAIDGLAGSGKSPLAAALARRLAVRHLNTGALYRAAALLALEHGLTPASEDHEARLLRLLARTRLTLTADGAAEVGGQRLSASLEVLPVEESVAQWAARPRVREALVKLLRSAVRVDAAVIEGRDVQTRLRPDASLALFVGGSAAGRSGAAGRLGGERRGRLLRAFSRRDALDASRAVAAPGAVRLPSVEPLDATVNRVVRLLERA